MFSSDEKEARIAEARVAEASAVAELEQLRNVKRELLMVVAAGRSALSDAEQLAREVCCTCAEMKDGRHGRDCQGTKRARRFEKAARQMRKALRAYGTPAGRTP